MLLDRLTENKVTRTVPHCSAAVFAARHKVKRFEFTPEVTSAIARTMRDDPDWLLANYQFAAPPYPECYLEFNATHFLKSLYGDQDLPTPAGARDATLGYLILGDTIHVVFEDMEGILGVSNFAYAPVNSSSMHNYHGLDIATAAEGMQEEIKLAQLLADSYREDLPESTKADLLDRYDINIDPAFSTKCSTAGATGLDVLVNLLGSTRGEIRNLLALLLWLNQPSLTTTTHVPATRKMVGNKVRAIAEHHVLRLRPGVTQKSVRNIFRQQAIRLRQHEVESHWRNLNRNDTCIHQWPLHADIRGHFCCSSCGQKRVRVKAHTRGDPSVGILTKDYQI